MIKTPVTNLYENAKNHLKNGRLDEARDSADLGIINVADKVRKGAKDLDVIEGITVRLWYERFWYFLEKNNLLLGQEDYVEEETLEKIING